MRLTTFTDYALRALLYLGANQDRLVTIQDIADAHAISKNHLMKVINQLAQSGIVETIRGRNGGLRLKREPCEINLGSVVRATETDFFMAECFNRDSNHCPLAGKCRLQHALAQATFAYLAVLDGQSLESLMIPVPQRALTPVAFHKRGAA